MKTFDVTYSYATQAGNSFGETEPMRIGRTISVKAETEEKAVEEVSSYLKSKKNLKVSACQH